MTPGANTLDGLRASFRAGARQCGLQPDGGPVVVAVSGGCDSMALANLMHLEGLDMTVVHVNYGIRYEADEDESFVQDWCDANAVPLRIHRPPKAPQSGLQEWARHERYTAFEAIAQDVGAHCVALAHHADDQLETQLLNLERGTGVTGLAGMPWTRPISWNSPIQLVRPLLSISGADLRVVATEHDWPWVEDQSNQNPAYRRNEIRAELADLNPKDLTELRQTSRQVGHRVRQLRTRIQAILRDNGEANGRLRFADLDPLPRWLHEWIVLEWISLGRSGVPRRSSIAREVLALRSGQTGRMVALDWGTIWRERDGWTMDIHCEGASFTGATIQAPAKGQDMRLQTDRGTLTLQHKTWNEREAPCRSIADGSIIGALLDASAFNESVTLRSWQPGDRFRPLGLSGRKKMKAFLTDRRVPPSERSGVQVLVSQGEIVWVVGHEISETAKVTDTTKEVIELTWVPEVEAVHCTSPV